MKTNNLKIRIFPSWHCFGLALIMAILPILPSFGQDYITYYLTVENTIPDLKPDETCLTFQGVNDTISIPPLSRDECLPFHGVTLIIIRGTTPAGTLMVHKSLLTRFSLTIKPNQEFVAMNDCISDKYRCEIIRGEQNNVTFRIEQK